MCVMVPALKSSLSLVNSPPVALKLPLGEGDVIFGGRQLLLREQPERMT